VAQEVAPLKTQNTQKHVYITADMKYHDFYQAENNILLCDIGHYESEQYTKTLLYEFLSKKIPNFAIVLSDINTNPVNYF
jgi:putative NIF3 family GTP cyclohydrolase 1 type 2